MRRRSSRPISPMLRLLPSTSTAQPRSAQETSTIRGRTGRRRRKRNPPARPPGPQRPPQCEQRRRHRAPELSSATQGQTASNHGARLTGLSGGVFRAPALSLRPLRGHLPAFRAGRLWRLLPASHPPTGHLELRRWVEMRPSSEGIMTWLHEPFGYVPGKQPCGPDRLTHVSRRCGYSGQRQCGPEWPGLFLF